MKYTKAIASIFLLLTLASFASASVFTYDHYTYHSAPTVEQVSYDRTTVYDSYGNRRSETITKDVNKNIYLEDYSYSSSYNNNYFYPTTSRYYNPYNDNSRVYVVHHQLSCDQYGYSCYDGASTGFGNRPIYSYLQYGDDQYTYPYYYQPQYNSFKGYYDWSY